VFGEMSAWGVSDSMTLRLGKKRPMNWRNELIIISERY
jgi:hypothetical protein